MRIRFALVDVVTVRELQSLRGRKVATRERRVAVIATRPATQSPVIGRDYEAIFRDLFVRQFRRWTVRALEHGVRERLVRIRRAHRNLIPPIVSAGD